MNLSGWAENLPYYFNSTSYFTRRLHLQLEPSNFLVQIENNSNKLQTSRQCANLGSPVFERGSIVRTCFVNHRDIDAENMVIENVGVSCFQ